MVRLVGRAACHFVVFCLRHQNMFTLFFPLSQVGTWETFRRPGYDARGRAMFDKRNSVQGAFLDESADTTWLTEFINQVGREKALALTQQLRLVAEIEMGEKIIESMRIVKDA